MCLDGNLVGGLNRWNWDGDVVVFDTTVPSQRPAVGSKRAYQIDVREFLLSRNNAVVRTTLRERIRPFADALLPDGAAKLDARGPGTFDFRAHVIQRWVGAELRYRRKVGNDPWQFPDETLTLRGGDCEDLAFVIASLLMGSGISGYHVRVALGEVRVGTETYDHAWVMYKNETGAWQLIEPLREVGLNSLKQPSQNATARQKPVYLPGPVRYVPSFLFNDEHLWIVARRGNSTSVERIARRTWRRMSPKFAGSVHLSILERALPDAPVEFLSELRGRFRRLVPLTPLIDPEDWVDPLSPSKTPYDPLQHFDNGLIAESWELLENNAARFRQDRTNSRAFSKAAHAIADFYAHSSYMAFAWSTPSGRASRLFHPDTWNDDEHLHGPATYGPNELPDLSRFDLHRFSKNSRLWKGSVAAAITQWDDRIISGRYAQDDNDHHGSSISKLTESFSQLPKKYQRPELGALPHHAEIAVDDADWTPEHRLFQPGSYAIQYSIRVNTAVNHIRKLWETGVP